MIFSPSSHAILLFLILTNLFVYAAPAPGSFITRVPITKREPRSFTKRQGSQTGAIGLGDVVDYVYSIQVSVGSHIVPVQLDTGSSDLWAISTDCNSDSCGSMSDFSPKVPTSSLKASGLDVELDYGDSTHPTFASGIIGSSTVIVAGLQLDDQFLVACSETNATVISGDLSGILGIGFPSPRSGSDVLTSLISQTLGVELTPSSELGSRFTDAFISALPTQGSFISRLVANGQLKQPMFTVTLEREDVEIGGNLGQLTIGELPNGVSNNSLTWVPVRLYSPAEGGLLGPSSNPNEVYPVRWEVPIDDVLLNGQTLPKPSLQDVSYTALIDSGTSFIAGPQNVVSSVWSSLSVSGSSTSLVQPPKISCSSPVHLSFVIGGKQFPVDPRDFLSVQEDVQHCDAGSLLSTDPPSDGALMSWILGDPFMKSNLIAFYFGNLTHPSVDPPRIGFLSTVPSNVDTLFEADVKSAQNKAGFIASSVEAPVSTFSAASTNVQGVAQGPTGLAVLHDTGHRGDAPAVRTPIGVVVFATLALGALLA